MLAVALVIIILVFSVLGTTHSAAAKQQLPVTPRTKVDITITGDMVHASTVNALLSVLELQTDKYRFYAEVRSSSNLVHLRSALLTEWYDRSQDGDVFIFIDHDQTFTIDDIARIVNSPHDVCGAMMRLNSQSDVHNVQFKNQEQADQFRQGLSSLVDYVGTGVMGITRPILTKIIQHLEKKLGYTRVTAYGGLQIVPFFNLRIEEEEGELVWKGEDFSFCKLVAEVGGTVSAFYSPTIGHEKRNLLYFTFPETTATKKEIEREKEEI